MQADRGACKLSSNAQAHREACEPYAAQAHSEASPLTPWDTTVDRYLSAAPFAVFPRPAHRPRDDMMFDLQVKNILCCLEDFNNGVPEDDNKNDGAGRRLK